MEFDPKYPDGDPSATDRSGPDNGHPEPADDLQGILDRPDPTEDCPRCLPFRRCPDHAKPWGPCRGNALWTCTCGMTFQTDAGFGRHLSDCVAPQP